jgi:hypothetical protein
MCRFNMFDCGVCADIILKVTGVDLASRSHGC